jgi:hypothetical protein
VPSFPLTSLEDKTHQRKMIMGKTERKNKTLFIGALLSILVPGRNLV